MVTPPPPPLPPNGYVGAALLLSMRRPIVAKGKCAAPTKDHIINEFAHSVQIIIIIYIYLTKIIIQHLNINSVITYEFILTESRK